MGAPILHVGDSVYAAMHGRVEVDRLTVCLRPSTDPAGELYGADVKAVELGENGPLFVVGFGDHWAYGTQIDPTSIAGPYTVEKRGERRPNPDRHEEEHAELTLEQAIEQVDDLAGVDDSEGIAELEPGDNHVYTDDETGDEVEVRRES